MNNLQPNLLIKSEDIRNNPELWIQKISVIIFADENGKPWWTKEYKFIPHYQRYNKAMKWLKETEFEEYNCRIIQNSNNEIEIITKNAFGKPASLEYQKEGIIKKIRKRLGEEVRKSDEELIQRNYEERDLEFQGDIEFPEAEFAFDWSEAFTPQQKKEWLDIGLSENDAEFALWLRDNKRMTPEQVLNYGDAGKLRAEFEKKSRQTKELGLSEEQKQECEEYRKSLKELGKSNDPKEFLESEYRELFETEAEELEELESEKEELGSEQVQVSYDLGRPDLAILWRKQLYFITW